MDCSTAGLLVHHQLLEFTQTHVHWVGDAIQPPHLCCPIHHLQSVPASGSFQMNQYFTSGGQNIGVSASTSVLPMNIRTDFFRMDWSDLLAVQGTLKSLIQHHGSKASILQCPAFFIVQLPHPYMTTGKIIRSDQISHSVVSDSLRPHESQHPRPPCPSSTSGVHWNSRPSSQWRHPAISSSVIPFSSCPQSLRASESFPMSQLFEWGGQSTEVSALASFLPKKSLTDHVDAYFYQ